MTEHVYIMGTEGGPYKIGYARNPSERLKAVQTGSPVPLKLMRSYKVENAKAVEKRAHRILMLFRAHGEWFNCTLEQAIEAIETDIPLGFYDPEPDLMTAETFISVHRRLGITRKELCSRLGISENTGTKYAKGRRPIPAHVDLACRSLVHDAPPLV